MDHIIKFKISDKEVHKGYFDLRYIPGKRKNLVTGITTAREGRKWK